MDRSDYQSMLSASHSTPKAGLPLFDEGDRPSYLGDWNGAMLIIDDFINELDTDDSATRTTIRYILDKLVELDERVTALEQNPPSGHDVTNQAYFGYGIKTNYSMADANPTIEMLNE